MPRLVATAHGAADYYTIVERQIHAVIEEGESIVVVVSRTGFTGQADVQLTLTGYLTGR